MLPIKSGIFSRMTDLAQISSAKILNNAMQCNALQCNGFLYMGFSQIVGLCLNI